MAELILRQYLKLTISKQPNTQNDVELEKLEFPEHFAPKPDQQIKP